MKHLEAISLPFLFFKVKTLTFLFYLQERYFYYFHQSFKKIDKALIRHYFFKNPYRIYQKFALLQNWKDPSFYGETPLLVYEKILKRLSLKKEDTFIELGFGRGRGLFFLSQFASCKCIGYEIVTPFYLFAQSLVNKFSLTNISLKQEDFFSAKLEKANVIYIHSTLLKDQEIDLFCKKILESNKKAVIVTTSFPLQDYFSEFTLLDSFEAPFLFGKATVFLNVCLEKNQNAALE